MSNGTVRLLTDLLRDAQEDIAQKDRLIKVLRWEVARLNQHRAETDRTSFDLSADSDISCLLIKQAG